MTSSESAASAKAKGSRILVLDDDSTTRRLLESALVAEGFTVQTFGTVAHAMAAIGREAYDLYLFDIILPDGDGLTCCRMVRERSQKPIIMLTVKGDLSDIVKGLELGADDYIIKPFRVPEVVARIRAQLRRSGELSRPSTTDAIRVGEITVDRGMRDALVNGVPAQLSQKEFEILELLALRQGKSVNKHAIMEEIWGYEEEVSEKILAVYVRRLRLKIEANPDEPKFLHTVRGFGYRLGG
ncbi:MAG TPA: response regulator transcription factor [Thermoanaerobaculia bacterium]|nr:response regulator transcription factor [Thermoanaerobaculia bacterium]